MIRPFFSLFLFSALITVAVPVRPAMARQASPVPGSLAEASRSLDWNATTRGPLLLIAPENLRPGEKGIPPRADSAGTLPTGVTATYFQAHLAPVGGLTAILPDTMTVVQYQNLPAPDVVQGIPGWQLPEFLLASLSPAQWEKLTRTEGIGYTDLTDEQRPIWRAIFPPGVTLSQQDGSAGSPVPVKPETPRFRVVRRVRVSFVSTSKRSTSRFGDNDTVGIANDPVCGLNYPQDLASGPPPTNRAFGAELSSVVPNRLKRSDLDYADPRWQRPVALRGAATVGELLARVRESTGVPLIADVRYAPLSVVLRGDDAVLTAADLLRTIALSVTGTYRKLTSSTGEALYVLTDDLVGLGTREVAIQRWLRNAALMEQLRKAAVIAGALESRASDSAPWMGGPYQPSAALEERLAGANRRLDAGDDMGEVRRSLLVPVAELPAALQEHVRKHSEEVNRPRDSPFPDLPQTPRETYRTDAVEVRSELRLAIQFPGQGTVYPPGGLLESDTDYHERRNTLERARKHFQNEAVPLPVKIAPAIAAERGLVVAPKSEKEADAWARLASARGMNRLFLSFAVDADPAQVGKMTQAAHRAAPEVAVYLRLRALRVAPPASRRAIDADRDINLLGETLTELAQRRVRQMEDSGAATPDTRWALDLDIQESKERFRASAKRGDYLALMHPSVQERVRRAVEAMRHEAGDALRGIALTDLYPPGYERTPIGYSGLGEIGDENLGYTPRARADFLQKFGADPVDLSSTTLQGGARFLDVSLPYFPDIVTSANSMVFSNSGTSKPVPGADLGKRWVQYRSDAADALHRSFLESFTGTGDVEVLSATRASGPFPIYVATGERLQAEQEAAKSTMGPMSLFFHQWDRGIFEFSYNTFQEDRRDGTRRSQRFARQFAMLLPMFVVGNKQPLLQKTGGFVLDFTDLRTPQEGEDLLQDLLISP